MARRGRNDCPLPLPASWRSQPHSNSLPLIRGWPAARKDVGKMPEVEVPRVSEAAPSYRLDVQLHELLMKPPDAPRLLPPPPNGKLQTLPEPVFPQYPELMSARDEDYFPVNGHRRTYKAKHIYRAAKGWAFPFFRSRIMPGEFHPI